MPNALFHEAVLGLLRVSPVCNNRNTSSQTIVSVDRWCSVRRDEAGENESLVVVLLRLGAGARPWWRWRCYCCRRRTTARATLGVASQPIRLDVGCLNETTQSCEKSEHAVEPYLMDGVMASGGS